MKTLFTAGIAILFATSGLAQKHEWSESDLNSYYKSMNETEELESLGDYKDDFVDCYLYNLQDNYPSYGIADRDIEGCSNIAEGCIDLILKEAEASNDSNSKSKSRKGNWSQEDVNTFQEEMDNISGDLDALGDYKQDFIDCYFYKLQDNYDNFLQANLDYEGCTKLSEDCVKEVIGE